MVAKLFSTSVSAIAWNSLGTIGLFFFLHSFKASICRTSQRRKLFRKRGPTIFSLRSNLSRMDFRFLIRTDAFSPLAVISFFILFNNPHVNSLLSIQLISFSNEDISSTIRDKCRYGLMVFLLRNKETMKYTANRNIKIPEERKPKIVASSVERVIIV